jgi:hypothetical protein
MARLLDEAKWGLDWILKTTFHDGFRPTFSMMDRWTDGIIGNLDDVSAQAGNNPASNLAAAATEALAARVLKPSDPILAGYSLKQAEEDWGFAMASMTGGVRGSATETAGHAIIAGLELWQATGNRKYADKSLELAKTITDSQQRSVLPGLTIPLTGFFYTGPDKTRILRYQHPSHEEAPTLALVRLCELFPDDPNWMKWYSAVTLYTEYFQKPMARLTEPYGMLANSIFKDDEYLQQPERGGNGATRDAFREQVQQRHHAGGEQGRRGGGPSAREPGISQSGGTEPGVGGGPESVRGEPDVGRRVRLSAAVYGDVWRYRGRAAGRHPIPPECRRALLADRKLP